MKRPMLASPISSVDDVPAGPGWLHQVKFDGMRTLAQVDETGVRFFTRAGKERHDWPDLRGTVGDSLLLDGEVVAFAADGRPSLRALQNGTGRRAYVVFDLLRCGNVDYTTASLAHRLEVLEHLARGKALPENWTLAAAYDDGKALAKMTLDQGLEGIVSKRRDSRYRFAHRSSDWLKLVH